MSNSSPDNRVRLNKYLADHGVASRRKADQLIDEGKVQVNGKKVFEMGVKIDPAMDTIKVNGKLVRTAPKLHYFIFNKPKSVVTTNSDPQGRPTVMDYFRKVKTRLFPVGRLDWDTEGLLLVTNDGEFANKIANPKSEIPKTYQAKLDGDPPQEKLDKLKRGVTIVGGKVSALECFKLNKGAGDKAWVQITIHEGKNRQIKKMFEKIGFSVLKLKRVSIGKLKLAGLELGDYREMTLADMDRLLAPPKVKPEGKRISARPPRGREERPRRKTSHKKS